MKALSLWEPWASLVATGAKTFETRHWSTHYRGPLVICAARVRDRASMDLLNAQVFQDALLPLLGDEVEPGMRVEMGDLRFGEAVAVVDLVDCIPTAMLPRAAILNEVHFGNYHPGRFAWKLANIRPLPRGIEVKGRQSLFDVPDSLVGDVLGRVLR